MATTTEGTPYVTSTDLVANYPATSLDLANRVDLVGVLPFANSAARTTAIPSPTDGQYSYLRDTDSTEFYNGSAWVRMASTVSPVFTGAGVESYQSSSAVTFNYSARNENSGSPVACIGFDVASSGETSVDKAAIGLERNGAQGTGRLRIMVNGANSSTPAGTADTMMSFQAGGGVYSTAIYNATTSAGANVFIETASGDSQTILKRSTSSIKYKTEVEDLDTEYADKALDLRPVWFRSTCEGDNPDWSHYGLIAEEVAEVDPRLVHWGGDDPLNPEPEGVQYDRLVPHLISVVQRQRTQITDLSARLDALEGGMK